MRIGELAARTGVSVRALRYYEEQRLLEPERSPSGQRRYPERAVDRVLMIQELYAAGLTSRAILGLLPCIATGESTPEVLAVLAAERDRIGARIGELERTRDRLDSAIARATTALVTNTPCHPA
ncbi:MerR family transcriptional regulator [Streptomyces sp. 8K308]|uniref:MerR family transcriptional regulator n=1 Tax=Streptomyces sp. 8K308 TaxID=2530388 RepID=UPI00104FFE4D|nr:MerR family transcriptional regulator [Streptomyces sp. 8K308]TDC27043.1 MerR family transcriptional regulator [Streptomyces sp. 8K308]